MDTGPDNKPQLVIPGADHIGAREHVQRLIAKPLRPSKAQCACDHGLFSDESNQQELFK